MISINDNVTVFVDEILNKEEELNVKSYYLDNGATVIDCGIGMGGSMQAGILYSRISLGGLAKINIVPGIIDGIYLHFSQAFIDRPAIACLCSAKPAWKIKTEGYIGTGFGPARAISGKPKAIFSVIDYVDEPETTVLCVESSTLPGIKEADYIAKQCATEPDCVVMLAASPGSLAGSIVNSTRTVEWALNRLFQSGYEVRDIASASSATPIAPVRPDVQDFMGSSFDSIAYYGMAHLYVKAHDDRFKDAVSEPCKLYGKPFKALIKEAGGDYSKIDPAMFAPAKLVVNGMSDGTLKAYGRLDAGALLTSYGLKN